MLPKLALPPYQFNLKKQDGNSYVFDEFRKKNVVLTPEEWVRQNFVRYLAEEKGYPKSLISIEMSLEVNKLSRRCDAVMFNRKAEPIMIVECKAPDVNINQKVFDQVAAYNIKLKVDYLVVTNGLKHYACKIDFVAGNYEFLKDIPSFEDI